jgi:Zn-dependent protease with chaperone function
VRFFKALVLVSLVPLLGFAVAVARFWQPPTLEMLEPAAMQTLHCVQAFTAGLLDGRVAAAGELSFCKPGNSFSTLACVEPLAAAAQAQACKSSEQFVWLATLSVLTLATSLLILLAGRVFSIVLGVSRNALALAFPPVATTIAIVVFAISIAHIAILMGSIYLTFDYWLDTQSLILLAMLGIAGVGTALAALSSLRRFFSSSKMLEVARPISLYEYPRLGLMLREVAKKLKAPMPDNVIVGFSPSFYVTRAHIQTPYTQEPLKGRTLHLSLTLMNTLSPGEFKAVLGHELAHFTGNDVLYSRRFAPVYAGLHAAMQAYTDEEKTWVHWVTAGARTHITELLTAFGAAEARISRAREFRADRLGASVATAEDIGFSLMKVSVVSSVFSGVMETMMERARMGRFSRNFIQTLLGRMRYDVDREKISPALQFALGDEIPHPTDSHPPTEQRIEALGMDLSVLTAQDSVNERFFEASPVSKSLDDMVGVQEDLTALTYHLSEDHWAPHAPDEKDVEEAFLMLMADFLALMVTVDDHVDDREITEAENLAMKEFGNFDCDGFRERCRHPEDLPQIDQMIDFANSLLTTKGAGNLITVLKKVAEADEEVHEKEQELLDHISQNLTGTDPDEDEGEAEGGDAA